MTDESSPQLVREDDTGSFGLYHPDDHVIETYVGDDREELHGEYYGENWHNAESDDLQAEIEAAINDVREDIEDLRGRELTDEQERELDRLELRVESHENTLELVKEATDEHHS